MQQSTMRKLGRYQRMYQTLAKRLGVLFLVLLFFSVSIFLLFYDSDNELAMDVGFAAAVINLSLMFALLAVVELVLMFEAIEKYAFVLDKVDYLTINKGSIALGFAVICIGTFYLLMDFFQYQLRMNPMLWGNFVLMGVIIFIESLRVWRNT